VDVVGFEEICHRYRFTLYLSGDQSWAEDIVSETFVRCWTSPEPIRTATVKSYLFAIARNLYLRELNRRARHTELNAALPDSGNLEEWAEGARTNFFCSTGASTTARSGPERTSYARGGRVVL
jgi:DNA-directed RNA polymerase specialized sigma24 family protein